jgi:RHS repeat-associated protein
MNGQSSTASYAYDGLGDRLQQTVGGQTTTYTLDINAALSQVLSDGTNTYLYGVDRIAQQNETDTEYFLGDDLDSVRQLTNNTGDVTLTRAYDPYGNTILNVGNEQTAFGYAGEYTDSTGQIYLRARYYDPSISQFIQPDTMAPNPQIPESWNLYIYASDNPIDYTDPRGMSICHSPLPSVCQRALQSMHDKAIEIKSAVSSGVLEPVEGFAQFVDYSESMFQSAIFKSDIEDMMWATTLVINDFDANRGPIWLQVWNEASSPYYIGQDWLPYRHTNHDKNPWCDPNNPSNCTNDTWVFSLKGDWGTNYWDKTANQAYHFWFYTSVTFFDGWQFAEMANFVHDNPAQWENYDYISSPIYEAPPPSGISKPDFLLAIEGEMLGLKLVSDRNFQKQLESVLGNCYDVTKLPIPYLWTNPGMWIRAHLKG